MEFAKENPTGYSGYLAKMQKNDRRKYIVSKRSISLESRRESQNLNEL
jgi:hypothetical protein